MNGVDDEAETQEGELYSCHLGILGKSLPLSCLFPPRDMGMIRLNIT